MGLLALRGGRWTQWALAAAIAFHVGLLSFGWGFYLWSIPMISAFVLLLRAARLQRERSHRHDQRVLHSGMSPTLSTRGRPASCEDRLGLAFSPPTWWARSTVTPTMGYCLAVAGYRRGSVLVLRRYLRHARDHIREGALR